MDRMKTKHTNQLEVAENETWTPIKISRYTVYVSNLEPYKGLEGILTALFKFLDNLLLWLMIPDD